MWKLVEQPLWESAEWSQIMMSKHNATFEEGDTSVQTLLICHLNTYITKRTTMMLLSFSGADKRRSQPGMQILSTRLSVGCLMNIIICETCWTFFFFFHQNHFRPLAWLMPTQYQRFVERPSVAIQQLVGSLNTLPYFRCVITVVAVEDATAVLQVVEGEKSYRSDHQNAND